ncbi:hypothetical protein LYNGBM3L_12690 [Moorena producens 3L]|uniref:Uncharacterized protein n=1 Tax=Moorena producens 3L TaxID=489825 RepID=F4XKW2_9CYAN|nr:hypothetical protein LYNGBM3L_12690 [Moorena producens 3L]
MVSQNLVGSNPESLGGKIYQAFFPLETPILSIQ